MSETPQGTLFESAARSRGDLAGVFEHDGATGYFYLYAPEGAEGRRVLGSLHVVSGPAPFPRGAVSVRWDAAERAVGLFIGTELWAAFDGSTGAGYAGDYAAGVRPEFPPRIANAFSAR